MTAQLTADEKLKPFSIWVEGTSKISISVNFEYLKSARPETVEKLFDSLRKVDSIDAKLRTVEQDYENRRPSLNLADHLTDDHSFQALEQALADFVAAQDN